MKKFWKSLPAFTLSAMLLSGCQQPAKNDHSESSVTAGNEKITSEGLVHHDEIAPIHDPKRKMMKKADMEVRVRNVNQTTVLLERAARAMNGLVMESQISNMSTYSRSIPYHSDSLKLANAYTTKSYLVVKIPASELDSFLSLTADHAEFIDSRNLHLEDATLDYLSNQLKSGTYTNEKAIGKSKSTDDVLQAQRYDQEAKDELIDRKVNNLYINDQVKYATISISLYQPEQIEYMIVPDIEQQMQPAFGSQFIHALSSGWDFFTIILIGLTHLWPFGVLALAILLTWKYRKNIFIRWKSV
ncbi:MAG: DUF4349 domain-containing protein [Taibaiella sp.]|nr:DUF4349 domain-containing protein [Taibaiella sp.]